MYLFLNLQEWINCPCLFCYRFIPMSSQVTTSAFGPVKTYELLHHMTGKGLSAKYHFPRQPCLYQPSMVAVQVILTNSSDHCIEEIHIGDRSPASLNVHCFNTVGEFLTQKTPTSVIQYVSTTWQSLYTVKNKTHVCFKGTNKIS